MEPDKKSNGAFIGLVVIVVILVLGGIFIWMSSNNTTPAPINPAVGFEPITNQDATVLDSLDTDLQTTDTDVSADVNSVN
jgi:flagellar basal body-associated protein FliL